MGAPPPLGHAVAKSCAACLRQIACFSRGLSPCIRRGCGRGGTDSGPRPSINRKRICVSRAEIQREIQDAGVDDGEDEHGREDEYETEDCVIDALFTVALLEMLPCGRVFKPVPDNHNDGECRGKTDEVFMR